MCCLRAVGCWDEFSGGLELTIGDRQAIIKPQLSEVDYLKKLCSAFEVHVGRRPERPTDNATAFGLYTQGIERLARFNKWDTATAVEMLDHATSLDPEFADAWAHLGEACWNHTVFFASNVEFVDRADAAVEKALELDPGNIVARTVYARMLWSPGKGYQTRDALRTLATMSPGESWRDELANRIDECSLFLLFVTPNSVGSEHCLRETNFASNRAKPIIAVHLAATVLPAGLELTIGDRQAIIKPLLSEVDYLKKLCSAIEGRVGRRPERPTDNANSPIA